MIDAKHENIYTGLFEYRDKVLVNLNDFKFCNINEFLLTLGILKKKIFFVGNCGILYKDMVKSYLNCESIFLEDSFVSSKYVGIAAFNKYKNGFFENSFNLSAMYVKKSSAEEKL